MSGKQVMRFLGKVWEAEPMLFARNFVALWAVGIALFVMLGIYDNEGAEENMWFTVSVFIVWIGLGTLWSQWRWRKFDQLHGEALELGKQVAASILIKVRQELPESHREAFDAAVIQINEREIKND